MPQLSCNKSFDGAEQQLWERYKERPVAKAIDKYGGLVTVFRTESGDTWTVVITHPGSGITCAVGSGDAWQSLNPLWGEGL